MGNLRRPQNPCWTKGEGKGKRKERTRKERRRGEKGKRRTGEEARGERDMGVPSSSAPKSASGNISFTFSNENIYDFSYFSSSPVSRLMTSP